MEEDSYQGRKFIPKELKDCPECGKPRIDELIRHTQLNASQTCDYLEWIPFEKFEMVKYIGSGGFGSVYSALWMEGPRWNWDDGAQKWARAGPMTVALKRLDNSQKISSSFINQIKTYHKCLQSAPLAETFGITKDPTSNYMIVMKYYENGNLYQYLDRSNGILSWRDMIDILQGVARGLERIHIEGKIHRNLHGGNLLIEDEEISTEACISDVGLYGPCYYHENKNSGQRPWYDRAHDHYLAKSICDGERLEIPDDTPKFHAELMQQCWDNEPGNRPTASYLYKKLNWINLIRDNPNPFDDNYYISEEKRFKMASQFPTIYTHPEIHPEAHFTSRPLYFPEFQTQHIIHR
ncbi:unnamed protein product [Rhizophagus irregularis]|nr:unnamed protein product [Rhizophagus irregularis]